MMPSHSADKLADEGARVVYLDGVLLIAAKRIPDAAWSWYVCRQRALVKELERQVWLCDHDAEFARLRDEDQGQWV